MFTVIQGLLLAVCSYLGHKEISFCVKCTGPFLYLQNQSLDIILRDVTYFHHFSPESTLISPSQPHVDSTLS